MACRAQAGKTTEKPPVQPRKKGFDLQDLLGPIGLALQGGNKQQQQQARRFCQLQQVAQKCER